MSQRIVFDGDSAGATDSAAPLRALIDQVYAQGGGTIFIPSGNYQMGSYAPFGGHPWGFYNLCLPSNVCLEGEPGTKLLQTAAGRGNVPGEGVYVSNVVVAVSNPATLGWNSFQAQPMYDAYPTAGNDTTITLVNQSDAGNFKTGDYIGVYFAKTGDVIPSEFFQVAWVDSSTGVIGLSNPIARGFPAPSVCNVTGTANKNVSLRNLIIQGSYPFLFNETFNTVVENCHFLYETPGGNQISQAFNGNTGINFRMTGGSVGPAPGAGYLVVLELPQRCCANVTFDHVTFTVATAGVAEFPINWKITNCDLRLIGDWVGGNSLVIQGWNMLVQGNTIHCLGATSPGACSVSDYIYSSSEHLPLLGGVRFVDNFIYANTKGTGNPAIKTYLAATQFKDNHIFCRDWTPGVAAHSASFQFSGNYLETRNAWYAVMGESFAGKDGGLISNNFMRGSGNSAFGVTFAQDYYRPGGYLVTGNTFEGFSAGVDKGSMSTFHSGTLVTNNVGE